MRRAHRLGVGLILASALFAAPHAGAHVIDGQLDDWGLTFDGGADDWTPARTDVHWTVEDYLQDTGRVWPGYGGQAYDAEALYVAVEDHELYIALVTGHDPENPRYGPGDFAIAFGYGPGELATFGYGLVTRGLAAGTLEAVTRWNRGLRNWWGLEPDTVTTVNEGEVRGTGRLAVRGPVTGIGERTDHRHWIYEAEIPAAAFGDDWGDPITVAWAMACGNDSIRVSVPAGYAPEPGAAWLLAGGLLPLAAVRRRRSQRPLT